MLDIFSGMSRYLSSLSDITWRIAGSNPIGGIAMYKVSVSISIIWYHNRIEQYEGMGSGWVVSNLVALDTTVWQLDPLRASTYHRLSWIINKRAEEELYVDCK